MEHALDTVDRGTLPVPAEVGTDWVVADRVAHQLVRVMRLVERRKSAYRTGPHGIERAAYVLLARLVIDGPQRSTALAEAVHSDPSTVSRQVAALVRVGLVERRSDPDDGRASLLAPTEEGLRSFAASRDHRNREIAALLADWDPADRTALADLLERFAGGLEDAAPPTETPAPTTVPAPGGEEDR